MQEWNEGQVLKNGIVGDVENDRNFVDKILMQNCITNHMFMKKILWFFFEF